MKIKYNARNTRAHNPIEANSTTADPISRSMCNAGVGAFQHSFGNSVDVGPDGSGFIVDGNVRGAAAMSVANATSAASATNTAASSASSGARSGSHVSAPRASSGLATHPASSNAALPRPMMSGVPTEQHASGTSPITPLSNSVSSSEMTGAVPTPIITESDARAYAALSGVPVSDVSAPRND